MTDNRVTKAVILAAGKGTRMGDLTADLPKPMIPVRGVPVLESIVAGLAGNGITEILIVVGYRPETIREHFGDGAGFGVKISYVTQETQDGTGRVLLLAEDFAGDDPFILSYGDILVPPESYAGLTSLEGADALLTVKHSEEVAKGGAIFIGEGQRVTKVIEKPGPGEPTSPWYNAGIYTFTKPIFEFVRNLKKSPRGEYELTDALQEIVDREMILRAVELQGDWADVRDPDVLEELNRE